MNHGYDISGPVFVQFRAAADKRDIILPLKIVADGEIHRCAVRKARGKKGKADGAYLLHLDGVVPAGGLQNHTDGLGWQNWHIDIGRALSVGERKELKRKQEAAKDAQEAAQQHDAARAQDKAQRLWEVGAECVDSPYLTAKKIAACGARILYGGMLTIPLRDIDGVIHTLQHVADDGQKRFLTGGIVSGHFHRIDGDETICICEGFATAATVHRTTGHTAIVAFDAGNLIHVAKIIRAKYPEADIVICADDDHKTKGNPGLTKAREAAEVINGYVAVPNFGINRRDKDTDFNDLAMFLGDHHVGTCISEAMKPVATEKVATGSQQDAVLEELMKLKGLEYDRRKKEVAKQLGVDVRAIDKEVARRREGRDTEVMPHWNITPWGEAVDGGVLLGALVGRLRRHVVMTEDQAVAAALWILFSWCHDVSIYSPILMVTSAEPNSGKSTLVNLLGFLIPRSLSCVGISAAVLYRAIEKWHPSIVVDEADAVFVQNEEIRAVVNSGWTRGSGVLRCDGDDNEPRLFPTFSPKIIGLKGRKVPDTTISRAVIIELKRKLPDEVAVDFDHVDDEGLARLRRQCLRWATDNKAALPDANPEIPPKFYNRVRANWKMMLAIAEECGWKQKAWQAAGVVEGIKEAFESSIGLQLLRAISAMFGPGADCILTRHVIENLVSDPEQPWLDFSHGKPITPKKLADLLGGYSIISTTVHPLGIAHGKGYERWQFDDALARYVTQGPLNPDLSRASVQNAAGVGQHDDFRSVRANTQHASKNGHLAHSHGVSHACTGEIPENAPPCVDDAVDDALDAPNPPPGTVAWPTPSQGTTTDQPATETNNAPAVQPNGTHKAPVTAPKDAQPAGCIVENEGDGEWTF
jgi:putative DNA primase/helicase